MNAAVITSGMWIISRYWKLARRFWKSWRPSPTARTIVRKLSSRSTIAATSRALRGPRSPIPIPRSAPWGARPLAPGHVVDAVARHRDDLAGLRQRADERELLRGRGAGDHVHAAERRAPAPGHARLDLVAGDHRRRLPAEPDLARDRARRERG